MTTRKLDKKQWREFFDGISKLLEGKQAEIEVASLALGDQVEAEWLPLLGMAYDPKADLVEVSDDEIGRPAQNRLLEELGEGKWSTARTPPAPQARHRAAASRTPAISSFLIRALADGPVLVTELEAGARAVGLLHEGRRIADTRVFKAGQEGARSTVPPRRLWDGMWSWSLPTKPSNGVPQTQVNPLAQCRRGTSARPSMAMVIPTSPAAFQAQYRGWRERAQAGPPAGMGAGVEGLHRLPAHAGVPQHRWGVLRRVGNGSSP
jgi:Family of unknown function (DUF5335)